MTTKMTSSKHPNWTIYKNTVAGQVYWSMQHNVFNGYMIEVWKDKTGEWAGQILSEQKIEGLPGETDWLPLQSNPFNGSLEIVKAEVIRRGNYWKKQDEK